MPYANQDQAMKDGNGNGVTVEPGKEAKVILTEYAPFQSKKGKTIPKHLGFDADTKAEYEFVGYAFHDAWKQLAEHFEPNETVILVRCLDNGTIYSDYELSIVKGEAPKKDADASAAPF